MSRTGFSAMAVAGALAFAIAVPTAARAAPGNPEPGNQNSDPLPSSTLTLQPSDNSQEATMVATLSGSSLNAPPGIDRAQNNAAAPRQISAGARPPEAPPPPPCTTKPADARAIIAMESLGGVLSLAGAGGPSSTSSAPVTPVPFKDLQLANFGHPGNEAPFWQTCGGVSTLIWQKIAPGPPPTPKPAKPELPVSGEQAAATDFVLATQVIAPRITVGFDPAGFGITGLASYFSLGGYDAAPIIRAVAGVDPATGQPASVVLRATLRTFVWDFGDGSTLTTTSLGTPYPGVSDISHVYDVRSDRSPLAVHGAYPVKVSAVFDVDYQAAAPGAGLNPTGWISFASLGLPPITSSAEHDHKVVEVRSILTTGPGA